MLRYVTPQQVNGWAKNFYQLIDVTPPNLREYRIVGVPHKTRLDARDFLLVTRTPVLQCRMGLRAAVVALQLIEDGVAHEVYVLKGGINEWIRQGFPVEEV